MIDIARLNALSTETLEGLKQSIEKVLATRFDDRLRVGAQIEFVARGDHIRANVIKINSITVKATETGDSVKPGRIWRIDKGMCKVVPTKRSETLPLPKTAVPHKPVTDGAGSW